MNFNNFTIKSQEAVQQAVQLVTQNGQQAIEAVHLLKAVIMTGESITNFLFQKLGVNQQNVMKVVDAQIASLPKVSGGEPYLSGEANAILQKPLIIHRRWATNMCRWNRLSWLCLQRKVLLRRY